MKVLLKRFHFNGHKLGFHPQTWKVRTTLWSIINSIWSSVLIALHFSQMRKGCTVFYGNEYRGISDIDKLSLFFIFCRKRNDVYKCMNHDWLKVRDRENVHDFFCHICIWDNALSLFHLYFSLFSKLPRKRTCLTKRRRQTRIPKTCVHRDFTMA